MNGSRLRTHLLPLLAVAIACAALFADHLPKKAATDAGTVRTRVLVGTITRVEAPYIFIRSDDLGEPREFRILTSPVLTFAFQYVPWEEGEREKAMADYRRQIDIMDPKSGDPIPPPPAQMKPAPLPTTMLNPGLTIGVISKEYVKPGQDVLAAAMRPLTEDEIRDGGVAVTFPY